MSTLFFFKQKTADERRISDCSADVWSSDLLVGELVATQGPPSEDQEGDAGDDRDPVLVVRERRSDRHSDPDRGQVHDGGRRSDAEDHVAGAVPGGEGHRHQLALVPSSATKMTDRKSTRLNSSH